MKYYGIFATFMTPAKTRILWKHFGTAIKTTQQHARKT